MVYQPVLQWGPSGASPLDDPGSYWAVASWYQDGQDGASHHSSLTKVNVGDVLVGVITLTGQSRNGFSYNCEFIGIPNSRLRINDVDELTFAAETLEVSGITKASDYPEAEKTAFQAIEIRTGTAATATDPTLDWTAQLGTNPYNGQHAVVVSDANPAGEVDIIYPIVGHLMVADFSAGQPPAVVRYWENYYYNPLFDGWLAPDDLHFAGDFMKLGYDQLLSVNMSGQGGHLMVADFSAGKPPAVVRYWEDYGNNPLFDGWFAPDDLHYAGDFAKLNNTQLLSVNMEF